jgi:hypothetical protein
VYQLQPVKPMIDFTLDELAEFSSRENDFIKELLKDESMVRSEDIVMEPSEESVNRILAFSKAYSRRKSKRINEFQLILN